MGGNVQFRHIPAGTRTETAFHLTGPGQLQAFQRQPRQQQWSLEVCRNADCGGGRVLDGVGGAVPLAAQVPGGWEPGAEDRSIG